jgi:hypothetical protein
MSQDLLPLSFEYFQHCRARGGRMPGQWVDGAARRLIDGTALDSRDPTRLEAGKCSVRTASGLGLRCGRYRNGRILRSAIAVGWHGGTSSMGRSVGCGWIRRYLDRSIHVSPVEVPI